MYVYIHAITLYDIFILHTFILNDILLKKERRYKFEEIIYYLILKGC